MSAISLLDSSGNYVPADLSLFTATSSKGVDMTQSFVPAPVPEPASAALRCADVAGTVWHAGLARCFSRRLAKREIRRG